MNRGGLYLAVYDISGDGERGRVAAVLGRYGARVQKSAFEARLGRTHRARLLAELEALGLETGWVALYRVDEAARRHTAGRTPSNPLAEEHHAYVV
jgi:CRISPR-associated endonuclease Cas2